MRRNLLPAALLGLLLAATSASVAFAANGSGHDDHGVRVLHVTLTNEQETDLDLGAHGPSAGDRFTVFATTVQNGKRVGVAGYDCVTLVYEAGSDPNGPPKALTDQCTGTITLRQGQITVQGLVNRVGPGPSVVIAVTGGTGAYRTAHGEAETSGPDEAGNEPVTIRLIL